jgi:hypothetical protein
VFPHCPFEVEEPWFSMHDRRDMPAPAPAMLDDKPRYMRAMRERILAWSVETSDVISWNADPRVPRLERRGA